MREERRRHSLQPQLLEEVQPWGNENPFLPLQLFRLEKSKIKSLPLQLRKYESVVQLQSYQLRLREKPCPRVSQQMPKVNINLYNSHRALLRPLLPHIHKDKTARPPSLLKLSQDSRQLQQELSVERKIFLMLHDSQRSGVRRSMM